MYEQGQEGSATDKLLVYAGMSNICSQFSGTDDGDLASHNHNLARAFSDLFLQALATFPMITPGTVDTVETLLVAVSIDSIPHESLRLTGLFHWHRH